MAKEKMKPLRELNLTNRFLFDQVMEDIGNTAGCSEYDSGKRD